MKKLIGHCGVDSGQLIITDPCYLKDFVNNEFTAKTFTKIKHPDGKTEEVERGSKRWFKIVEDINQKKIEIISERMEELPKDYSYQGCAMATLSKEHAGELKNEMGVATSTGYGDGSYPVYATYKDNRIQKVEVIFFDNPNDIEEDEDEE